MMNAGVLNQKTLIHARCCNKSNPNEQECCSEGSRVLLLILCFAGNYNLSFHFLVNFENEILLSLKKKVLSYFHPGVS